MIQFYEYQASKADEKKKNKTRKGKKKNGDKIYNEC